MASHSISPSAQEPNAPLTSAAAGTTATLLTSSMNKVEQLLTETYTQHSLETQVNALCMHVIEAGGKRMRPRLVLLSALALPHFDVDQDLDNICHIAAAIELLHTATLVHDDVIDKAPLRRGKPTLNETDGNHAAVLAGDYLFTRCFNLLQRPRNFDVIEELNRTLSQLVVGELYQLEHEGDVNLSLDVYYETIYHKTGVLFELAASAPALIVEGMEQYQDPLKEFGRQLGISFQIKDDMLDYSADSSTLGKDAGTDLNDQRITLPVLMALKAYENDAHNQEQLLAAIKTADLEAVRAAIAETKALEQCELQAQQACAAAITALEILPPSAAKDELIALCHKAVNRSH